jgi:hypothetical protein
VVGDVVLAGVDGLDQLADQVVPRLGPPLGDQRL